MSRTILLADDSVTIQKVIELTFMDEDYEVVAVGNGDDAIEKLDEITPDFVIADVHMPGANGYDVAKHSKSLRPEVPVLLLVGTFEPFDEEQAEKCGCDAYLKKPFDSQELQRLVEELSAEATRDSSPLEATGWRAESPLSAGESVEVEPPAAPSDAAGDVSEASAEPATPQATPFSIGLEDDDEPAPTRVEPPAESAAPSGSAAPTEPPPAPPAAPESSSVAPPDDEPVFDLGDHDDQPPALEPEPSVQPPPPEPPAASVPVDSAPVESTEVAPEASAGAAAGEAAAAEPLASGPLSDDDVDRIARRIVDLLGDRAIRDVAWEVVPDLAEVVIRGRLRELETQVESAE